MVDAIRERKDFEEFLDTLLIKNFLSESDKEQWFQVWMERALRERFALTDEMLEGWSIAWCPHSSHMSVEYNTSTQWEVRRTAAPYSFSDGVRSWFGATIEEAWGKAQADYMKRKE
jgi:hypothetical protein